ncbi:serine hydrolase [Parasphingorhabdus sp.]|uniref:serine hydrolase domain-containing protein n=1 Tax=Parasphingorhabdus sp. TaxID=2709688 RepID=UPI003266AD95
MKTLCLCCVFLFAAGWPTERVHPREAGYGDARSPAAVMIDFGSNSFNVTALQGEANHIDQRALQPNDPVRIASISKFVMALGVMRLVDQGKLDLDRDVNDYLSWDLHNPAFPRRSITLRQLMSHTAGLRDAAGYAIAVDIPLARITTDPKAWDLVHEPGSYFAYSNLNSQIIAAVIETTTQLPSGHNAPFSKIMAEQVFAPLGLTACYNWVACTDETAAKAVTLYDSEGKALRDAEFREQPCSTVPATSGKCGYSKERAGVTGSPFSPQGGLRISAQQLAKVGQMFLNGGRVKSASADRSELMKTRPFLKPGTVAELLKPIWVYDGNNGESEDGYFCAYGLSVHILALAGRPGVCKDDPFGDGITRYGHSGEAYGLRSGLWFDPESKTGTAFFRTQVPENDPAGHCIFSCD